MMTTEMPLERGTQYLFFTNNEMTSSGNSVYLFVF